MCANRYCGLNSKASLSIATLTRYLSGDVKQQFWSMIAAWHNCHYSIMPQPIVEEPESREEGQMKAHYLIGEAGYPNYGDELITREWVKYLAQVDPETPVVLDCTCAGPAAAIVYGLHPKVMMVDTVAQLSSLAHWELQQQAGEGENVPVAAIAQQVDAQLHNEGLAPRYAAGIELLTQKTRDCHVIGGGYMHSEWNAGLGRLSAAAWTQHHDIPTIVSGVGLEPLTEEDARYVRQVAQDVVAFSCRDQKSVTAIDPKHEFVTLAPDDCFVNGLEGVYVDDATPLPQTMLCVQSDLVADKEALLAHVLAVFKEWGVESGERIGVVECIPRDSIDAMNTLRDHGYEPQLFPLQHMLDFGFPARAGQRWLSTRYHPHLLAAARGCEGSYIVVKPGYYDVKHQAVLRMGSRWTESVVGNAAIAQPGSGFSDLSVVRQYRDRIREQLTPMYGIPPEEH